MTKLKNNHCEDHALSKILSHLPTFGFSFQLRPDRSSALKAKQKFLTTGTPPIFEYPRAKSFNHEVYIHAVHQAKKLISASGADPMLTNLYLKKCDENIVRAELIKSVAKSDDQKVTKLSLQLFGSSFDTRELFEKELTCNSVKVLSPDHAKRIIKTDDFEKMVRKLLDHYGMYDWKITRRRTPTMSVVHGESGRKPNIIVPKERTMSVGKATRLLTHEIEVHALRMYNAINGPLHVLRRGTAGYINDEEGLALYCQQFYSGHAWKRIPGFWDAYACALARETDFAETYRVINQLRWPDEAWRICTRVYKGITDTSKPGVGFFRDHIYRTGYIKIKKAIAQDDQLFPKLFSGHFGLHDLPALENLHIPNGRQPDFIADQIVHEVIG